MHNIAMSLALVIGFTFPSLALAQECADSLTAETRQNRREQTSAMSVLQEQGAHNVLEALSPREAATRSVVLKAIVEYNAGSLAADFIQVARQEQQLD